MRVSLGWIQLALAWVPVWVLYGILVQSSTQMPWQDATAVSLRGIAWAAVLSLAIGRLTRRVQWPLRIQVRFVTLHLLFAFGFALAWISLVEIAEAGLRLENPLPSLFNAVQFGPRIAIGIWLYGTVAGISYATQSTQRFQTERERALRAESETARAQLQAVESRLNPHFVFNALNTVAGLIRRDSRKAERAVEHLGELLRTTLTRTTNTVTLREEWAFVSKYLAMEQLRFADRFSFSAAISDTAMNVIVPTFAVQTLVENTIRHALRDATDHLQLTVNGCVQLNQLTLTVADNGPGASPECITRAEGFGLRGLRQRLLTVFGDEASLTIETAQEEGFRATLRLPARSDQWNGTQPA